jgi:putative transposase
MSHYRRCYVPGDSYFFTVATERRARILGNDLTRDLLRAAFRECEIAPKVQQAGAYAR